MRIGRLELPSPRAAGSARRGRWLGLAAGALVGAALLAAGLAGRAQEEPAGEKLVAGLSQSRIAITADFDGSQILVFGAVKREAPPPEGAPLHVIVALKGPDRSFTVRRKARRFGIWVNTDAVEIDSAPVFYALATTGPWREIISDVEDLRWKISIERAIRSVGAPQHILDSQAFTEALIRLQKRAGLYRLEEGAVSLADQTLFRAAIALPANLVEGDYTARIFLTRGRKVIDHFETRVPVRKVGLERWIYNLAHRWPLAYGLLSLAIAIAAGWAAAATFRALRKG